MPEAIAAITGYQPGFYYNQGEKLSCSFNTRRGLLGASEYGNVERGVLPV